MDESGYIKFNCEWIKADPISRELLLPIIGCRDKMHKYGLVGVYDNGNGFGNVSVRTKPEKDFIITGSKTGGFPNSNENHYSKVVDYSLEENTVKCVGPIKASSESLSHAMIYQGDVSSNGIIHAHNLGMWNDLINSVPTTSKSVEYGTPEMGLEILRLFDETEVRKNKILVMGGHEEGLMTFGRDLKEAEKIILKYFNKI